MLRSVLRSLPLAAGLVLAGTLGTPPVSAAWSPLGSPTPPEVVTRLAPGRPERLYAQVVAPDGNGYFLWGSPDGGATWRDLQPGLTQRFQALAIDPADPAAVWVWTLAGELWGSGDAGATWSRVGANPDVGPLVVQLLVDPRRPGTFYLVTDDARGTLVWVSRDGGASFAAGAPLPPPPDFVQPVVRVQPARGELLSFGAQGLVASVDGGRSWQPRGRFRRAGFTGGELAPSAPDVLYGLPNDGNHCLVRSDDDGAHWRALAPPPGVRGSAQCLAVAIDPGDARHVWAGTRDLTAAGTFRNLTYESHDGGASWLRGFTAPDSDLVAAGGERLYTGGSPRGARLQVSLDGGRSWEPADRGILAGDLRYGLVAQQLPPGAGAPGRRIVALDASLDGGFATVRSDGGRDWTDGAIDASWLADAGGSTVLAVDIYGFLRRSTDGGATWAAQVSAAPPLGFALRPDLAQPRYVALEASEAANGGPGGDGKVVLWASDDAGATWRRATVGLPIDCGELGPFEECPGFTAYAVDPFDPSRRWVTAVSLDADPNALFVTADAGASWHAETPLPDLGRALAADPALPGRLLIATDSGLFVSTDGGQSLIPLGDLPDGAVVRQFARDPNGPVWYAATKDSGIFRSLDGGGHWTLLDGAPDLEDPTIAVDPRRPTALLAAFVGQGLWRWTP